MIIRLIIVLMFSLCIQSCGAETQNMAREKSSAANSNELAVESTITNFSTALTKRDLGLLLTIADQKDIYLVRLFTSGNLGGRGSPLSQAKSINSINKELAFDIKNQTPFELPELFANLPIKSAKALPRRTLAAESDTAHFDQWGPILKKSLSGAPEVVNGDSIALNSSKYFVYAEAQIIDDILVGGFAVFERRDDKLKLVALIDLL
ncbi:MAG: hypothetical protein EOO52_10845 [Gammaproteobacteria bacterium]|nr:MAG: hypothetical protein EOO52_10845 [Gammaproteobacteria bacterium]